jgi:hypothetical protein
MLTPTQLLDKEYLEVRCMLLETAAALDRYDSAVKRCGVPEKPDGRIEKWRAALHVLDDPHQKERAVKLLELFSDPGT